MLTSQFPAASKSGVWAALIPWLTPVLVIGAGLFACPRVMAAELCLTIPFPSPARVVFSPDSKLVALQRNTRVEVWDLASRKRLWSDAGTADPRAEFSLIFSVPIQFSPDSSLLAIAEGRAPGLALPPATAEQHPEARVQLRSAKTGELDARVGACPVYDAAFLYSATRLILFARDGKTIFIGHFERSSGKTVIETYDVASAQRRATATIEAFMFYRTALSPDGTILAAIGSEMKPRQAGANLTVINGDGQLSLALWNLPQFTQRAMVQNPTGEPRGTPLVFSRDGKQLATGMKLWDVQEGRPLRTQALKDAAIWHGKAVSIACLAMRPDGITAVMSSGLVGEGVWIGNLQNGTVKEALRKGAGNHQPGGILSPSGALAASMDSDRPGKGCTLWDAQTGRKLATLKPKETGKQTALLDVEHTITFSPDESYVAYSPSNGLISLWNIAADRPVDAAQ